MNHFQQLNEVKELKVFFFAQHAKVSADQNRADKQILDRATSALRGAQQTSKYISVKMRFFLCKSEKFLVTNFLKGLVVDIDCSVQNESLFQSSLKPYL